MRNGKLFIALLGLGALSGGAADAQTLDSLTRALADMPGYAARVTYAVTLPQAENDIVYTVDLSQPADDPDAYLIDWSVDTPSGPVDGFTAWFNGHFYNYRNHRLQELHRQWDDNAVTDDARSPQNSAQFASLLPSRLAAQMALLADSTQYSYTLTRSANEIRIDALRLTAGEADAELTWRFHPETLQPLSFYADYNPGAIASQQVSAVYSTPSTLHSPLSEASLRSLYPDAFERYRESQFAIENMRGQQLPAFSLPVCGSASRMTRRAADALEGPTALVLLDSESTLAPQLIDAVRSAIDRLPADANVIWACTGKNPDAVSELTGPLRRGETTLLGSRSLARDCGAASLPVVMAVEPSGRVSDLIIGLNNQLEIDVIRMLTAM